MIYFACFDPFGDTAGPGASLRDPGGCSVRLCCPGGTGVSWVIVVYGICGIPIIHGVYTIYVEYPIRYLGDPGGLRVTVGDSGVTVGDPGGSCGGIYVYIYVYINIYIYQYLFILLILISDMI